MSADEATGAARSPLLRYEVLTKRSDFLRAAGGRRQVAPGFVLQGWDRGDGGPVRVGFTCSKKVGNAVARNRAKRRLRALAHEVVPQHGQAGWDYVLIGRAGATATRPFADLRADLERGMRKLGQARDRGPKPNGRDSTPTRE